MMMKILAKAMILIKRTSSKGIELQLERINKGSRWKSDLDPLSKAFHASFAAASHYLRSCEATLKVTFPRAFLAAAHTYPRSCEDKLPLSL